jgi:hypothetical protein
MRIVALRQDEDEQEAEVIGRPSAVSPGRPFREPDAPVTETHPVTCTCEACLAAWLADSGARVD